MLRKSVLLLLLSLFIACIAGEKLRFETRPISEDANMWWARALADIDGDGDPDIFRLPTHDGHLFEVWVNQLR